MRRSARAWRGCFEQAWSAPCGYVLPLRRDPAGTLWQTGPWFLRDERCYLIPGDSPLGYGCRWTLCRG